MHVSVVAFILVLMLDWVREAFFFVIFKGNLNIKCCVFCLFSYYHTQPHI